jgi:catechol 2,3-dioxygenase-like lactoylglutathione lyase family enzyme
LQQRASGDHQVFPKRPENDVARRPGFDHFCFGIEKYDAKRVHTLLTEVAPESHPTIEDEDQTRRQAIGLIGIGIGTSIANGITPGLLLAQTRDRLAIGTAGKGGVFYPSGTEVKTLRALEANGVTPDNLGTHAHQDYPQVYVRDPDGVRVQFADVAYKR